jgi:hypothetical protein
VRIRAWRWLALFSVFLFLSSPIVGDAQQAPATLEVPEKFSLDRKTAARLRPELLAQSSAPTGRYAIGLRVFEKLVQQLPASQGRGYSWQLRIVKDGQINASSSPDGTIFVETGLADLADNTAGLWASVLSHEISHVVRRDWARRYLYEESLRQGTGADLVLGEPGLLSGGWKDPKAASLDLAKFCRQLEMEADLGGLMLMARAGYHPDFVPALHHLLHAQSADRSVPSILAMHPCWEERDRELDRAYVAASMEFEHRWPEPYASPGGNPPIVVFAERPNVKKTGVKKWEIRVPLRCQNLAGAVEVVLQTYAANSDSRNNVQELDSRTSTSENDKRQLTGCTSPRTTITFALSNGSPKEQWAEVFVLDGQGQVLSRMAVAKLQP